MRSRASSPVRALLGLLLLSGCAREPGARGKSELCAAPGGRVARCLPPPTALGYLETGVGGARRSRPRTDEASDFVCDGGRCVQRHVRLPDDGEWRCAERDGVVWCAGGEPAAGVVRAPADRGFSCGLRRGAGHPAGERVCVDPSPDYPGGRAGKYACRFDQERGIERVCDERKSAVVPPRSDRAPDCWLDRDCGGERCDRGRCGEES